MINSKQRAYLRALANKIDAVMQLGKAGISDNFIKQVDDYLVVKEIMKITVLKVEGLIPSDIAAKLANITGADVVSVTGRKIVLYRRSEKLVADGKEIVLPK